MSAKRTTEWSARVQAAYEDLGRELWALFYTQCGDRDRAHDALQEAFVRLQAHDGEAIRDPRAWLLQVGRNWLRDVARRGKVAARSSESLDEVAATQNRPERVLDERERDASIRAALQELKIEDREVLVLRYSLGWSSNRIADVLGSTAAAVDMRLSRARKRLGELLERAGVKHDVD